VDPSNPDVVYIGGSTQVANSPSLKFLLAHGVLRIDTGNMRDTPFVFDIQTGTYRIFNDGDDIDKVNEAFDPATNSFHYPTAPDGSTQPYFNPRDGLGEGVAWYDIEQGVNNDLNFQEFLPGAVLSMVADNQGRLLFGTENGIYRGAFRGTGYDFTSG